MTANELNRDAPLHRRVHTLEAKGLKKHYGSRRVVNGVDLSVKSGEVVGLLGPNGAGKTTTFYMVVGLVVADDGSIELDGQSILHMPIFKRARLGLSYLPQEASVFRKLTVEENIKAILELQQDDNGRPLGKKEINERLEMLLDELQIQHIRTNTALSLSGGERRRTEIARALASTRAVFSPRACPTRSSTIPTSEPSTSATISACSAKAGAFDFSSARPFFIRC